MPQLDLQEIIRLLSPRSGTELIWDIMLYLIFFCALIAMFMQSDKTLLPALMMGAVALIAVISKLQVIPPRNIITLLLNAVMGIFPIMVAAFTKAPKSRLPALLAGVTGFVYTAMFLLFVQQ
ncbi:MAG: hypothetical protein ACUVSX_05010 [Aggregatilineales bacterium]